MNKLFFPFYAYKQYKDLWDRVFILEDAMKWMLRSPEYVESDSAGFNGQQFRKQIFQELLELCKFEAVIETGTYTGDTTGFMAQTSGLPVYTCELNQWFYDIARRRLSNIPGINFSLEDSRNFLSKLAANNVAKKKVFIYLDSHWYKDLPLKQEIELISSNWKDFVIMIDDFKVSGDEGYTYDHYSKSKSLTNKVFGKIFLENNLAAFFPSAPSAQETGFRRGCVILAPVGSHCAEKLQQASTLRYEAIKR